MHSALDTPCKTQQSSSDSQYCHQNHHPNPKHNFIKQNKGAAGELWEHKQRVLNQRVAIEELDDAIGQLNRSINASSYQLLLLIREFDERAGWLQWSFNDGVSWLKWRCDIGTGTAREKLRIAHALKELPLISAAFAEGNLSYSKVRVITRVATPENEAELIELARRMTVLHLTEHCKQRSNAQPSSTATALAAQNSREFRVWHDHARGTVHFSIELPAEEGELLEKAVEKAATQLSTETGISTPGNTKEEPAWSAIQADAVVDVMRHFLSAANAEATSASTSASTSSSNSDTNAKPRVTPNTSNCSADHHLVMIHVDANALTATADNQTIASNPDSPNVNSPNANESNPDNATSQYPIETVRRLCCDGSIAPIIENSKGEPLNVGRKIRTVTTAIRRALWSRDKGCAFPGCSHTRFVDAHHIKHWADGGETSIENMVLLCTSHHKLVHEGGYKINRDQSGELFFRRPDGKAVPHCGYYRDDWVDTGKAQLGGNYVREEAALFH